MIKEMFKELVLFVVFGLIGANSVWSQTVPAPSSPPGYQGIAWGTSLDEFRSSTGSKITYSVDGITSRGLDYLLLNFHEVGKDDPARAPKFSVQTIAGDKTLYIFYDGKFCAASQPLSFSDFWDQKKVLESKDKPISRNTYEVFDVFSGEFGMERVFFHYTGFEEGPTQHVYLVLVTSYYEAPVEYGRGGYGLVQAVEGDPQSAFLVHVAEDYQNGENAYTDWLENKKNSPLKKLNFLQSLKCGIEH